MVLQLNARATANIRAELARRKLTQEEFAEQIGMGRTAFVALMTGRTHMTLSKLEVIAAGFEIEPSKLLND